MPDPVKKIAGGVAAKNRNPITTTVVRGKDAKGTYTDTNTNQLDDLYAGSAKPQHKTNAWFNGLTQAQKNAHNAAVRAKEAREAIPPTPVKGMTGTSRVYDPKPAVKAPIVPTRRWTREEVKQPFGGHVSVGTTTDEKVIASAYAKNKIDVANAASKNNTYEARDFTPKETLLWNKGRLSDRDNPIGKDTIGRGAALDKKIAIMNTPRKKVLTTPVEGIVSKEDGGRMINGKIFKQKPELKAKPKTKSHTNAATDDDCNCGKMSSGGSIQQVSSQGPRRPRPAGMYAGGGDIPTIDDESPIRYKRQ